MAPPDGSLSSSKAPTGKAKAPEPAAAPAVSEQDRVEIVKRVVRAWESAGVDVACELCGCPDWSLVATDEADGLAVPLRHGDKAELAQCYLAYALHCRRCGNLRLFGKQKVEELAASDDSE